MEGTNAVMPSKSRHAYFTLLLKCSPNELI